MVMLTRIVAKFGLSRVFYLAIPIAFSAGAVSAGWLAIKWSEIKEAGRLRLALEQRDKATESALNSLHSYYESQLSIEKTRLEISEVHKYVPTNSICDVSDGERRVLNNARTGMPEAPARINGESAAAPETRTLQRYIEVKAHADCGLQYRKIAARYNSLIDYLEGLK